MNKDSNHQDARRLIAGGVADFITYLIALDNPVIVGKQYPRNRLMKAANEWAAERQASLDDADIGLWLAACQHGYMRKRK